jgi:hypothetical protein
MRWRKGWGNFSTPRSVDTHSGYNENHTNIIQASFHTRQYCCATALMSSGIVALESKIWKVECAASFGG